MGSAHLLGNVGMPEVHIAAGGAKDDALEGDKPRTRDHPCNIAQPCLRLSRQGEPYPRVAAQPTFQIYAETRRRRRAAHARRGVGGDGARGGR